MSPKCQDPIALSKKLSNAYFSVDAFNRSCGNSPDDIPADKLLVRIQNQCKRIASEVQETYDGASENDLLEVIDGVADVIFTAYGLASLVQARVGDVGGAVDEVCENNTLKYTHDIEEARGWLEWYESDYNPANVSEKYYVASSAHEGVLWHAIKRVSDNKIMKPPHHPKPDLAKYLYINMNKIGGIEDVPS